MVIYVYKSGHAGASINPLMPVKFHLKYLGILMNLIVAAMADTASTYMHGMYVVWHEACVLSFFRTIVARINAGLGQG